MSQKTEQNSNPDSIKPFISIVCIIFTLLSIVFLQMEERRMGYALLKLTKEQKKIVEERRQKSIVLAKLNRPQQVEKIAQSKSTLKKLNSSQIIHLTGTNQQETVRDLN